LQNVKTISLIQDIYRSGNLRNMQEEVIRKSDCVVFNSKYTYNEYRHIPCKRSEIISLGVDFDFFTPGNPKIDLDIPKNSILFIGSTTVYPKGFDLLLKTSNALKVPMV